MKKSIVLIITILVGISVIAQTNTFPSTGNVGIGTSIPAYMLDVYEPAATHAYSRLKAGHTSFDAAFLIDAGSSATGSYINFRHGGDGFWDFASIATGAEQGISFYSYKKTGGAGKVFTINKDGKVGISTANPIYRLDVYEPTAAHAYSRLKAGNTTYDAALLIDAGSTATSPYINFQHGGDGYWDLGSDAAGADQGFSFYSYKKSSGAGRVVTINKDGDLFVNGFIKAKKLTVTQTGWSDYVFAKGYKLRSLSSLERFIKQNKHLPDLPSASEVEEHGINVGDNQALLLKKIEELTLYMIIQQKQIDKQTTEIQQLKKQISKQ